MGSLGHIPAVVLEAFALSSDWVIGQWPRIDWSNLETCRESGGSRDAHGPSQGGAWAGVAPAAWGLPSNEASFGSEGKMPAEHGLLLLKKRFGGWGSVAAPLHATLFLRHSTWGRLLVDRD